ncbi:hypothetical protein ACIGZJ_26570 [Kitasatospora sp. NPDC052868]|uniref:hypothetical protein n=1 Tax=Kitasatospora sp. NPDC052868 TaxID=3364060 RepID=UPI0037C73DF2
MYVIIVGIGSSAAGPTALNADSIAAVLMAGRTAADPLQHVRARAAPAGVDLALFIRADSRAQAEFHALSEVHGLVAALPGATVRHPSGAAAAPA